MSNEFLIPSTQFINNGFILDVKEKSLLPGSVVFVAGPNGAGKSTFLKGLSNLIRPQLKTPALYLSSQFQPQEGLTGNDLLDLFEIHDSPYFDRSLLADFKISNLLDLKLENLSSGERQKIFLCTALFHKNSVLALDEPLNFLDISFYSVLQKTIERYAQAGRIFFISNHDFNWSLTFSQSQTWVVFQNQIFLSDLTTKVLGDIKLKDAFGVSFKMLDLDGHKYILAE